MPRLPRRAIRRPTAPRPTPVITSYSIHYTKLYEADDRQPGQAQVHVREPAQAPTRERHGDHRQQRDQDEEHVSRFAPGSARMPTVFPRDLLIFVFPSSPRMRPPLPVIDLGSGK